MAEPISSTATGIGIKFYGFTTLLLVAALLSWLLVVMTRMPRLRREWAVSLISTLIGSISGGAYVIHSYQLHSWGESPSFRSGRMSNVDYLYGQLFAGYSTTSINMKIQTYLK